MDELKAKIAGEITLSKDPGTTMRKWREIFGISQTELSNFLKISTSTISDYESNRRTSPGVAVVSRFVDALFAIDQQRGGEMLKKFKGAETVKEYFSVINFQKQIPAMEFAKAIEAKIIVAKEKLSSINIFGATILDSLRVILELPYESFMQIYSTTTQRALIFTNVSTGRSPMVAIRVTPIKPAIVVIHGIEADKIDKLALKIAESEAIPLLSTTMEIEEMKKKLSSM